MSAYRAGTSYAADEDAAQSFLRDKLAGNKYISSGDYSTDGFNSSDYTPEQLSSLNSFGGPKKFGKGAYETVTNQDEIDSFNDKQLGDSRGFDADSDSGRNYASGAWGSGDLDAAALASKYNLDTSQEGRGEGHIWGRNADGSEVYIGKSSMDLASNEELIKNHSKQAGEEVDHSGVPESLSSSGDIKGAILTEWSGGPAGGDAPEPIMGEEAIVDSPEIQQAKARVGKYENDILSGKTSQSIYGGANDFFDGYKLNLMNNKQGGTDFSKTSFNPTANLTNSFSPDSKDKVYEKNLFTGSNISPYETADATELATASFLKDQKNKTINNFSIKPKL